jgi:hypothetical protein
MPLPTPPDWLAVLERDMPGLAEIDAELIQRATDAASAQSTVVPA